MPLEPNIPKQYPVTVFSSLDENAPKLTAEKGSMKTVLKACLVNGYGDKAGLNWQVVDETAERAVFYSTDPDAHGHGLMVDNSSGGYVNAYMVGGERFAEYLGYGSRGYNNFSYNNSLCFSQWRLIATARAFCFLVMSAAKQKSQMLFFGDISGAYKDTGNTAYLNTSFGTNSSSFDDGNFYYQTKPPLILCSQWQNGGNAPLAVKTATPMSAFLSLALGYPDAVYNDASASAVVLVDNTTPRGALPIFACANNLNSIAEFDALVVDARRFMKVNFTDGGASGANNFLLPLDYWAI